MKVPVSWLAEYVDIPEGVTSEELAERLALSGTEVERISHSGLPSPDGNAGKFVIGQVRRRAAHPNADKLSLCDVDIGESEPAQIVCGAKNFKEGDKAVVCLESGVLPDGRKLTAANIRGVESHGMMCSEQELGISTESAGILILPEDAPVGRPVVEYMPLSDDVLELEVTPNRPDCLSVYGVAREVAAVTGARLEPEPVSDVEPQGDDRVDHLVSITVNDHELCPRYGARLIAGVTVAPSPAWLKARIVAAGMRPVNNIVDITNYVMWTLGEPMHAFDLAKIAGSRLDVRRAANDEEITTIDGTTRKLTHQMLVIADGEKPSAIAGIMGSEASEVGDDTADILLEAANFQGRNIMETSMALGLRSESSTRFEKGLDYHLIDKALAMASRMIVELAGGRLVPGQIDIHEPLDKRNVVHLSPERVTAVLGVEVPRDEMIVILERLGFDVAVEEGGLHVTVPSFRADVEREIDLIEEVARIFGLNLIPPSLPSDMRVKGGLSEYQSAERDIARALRQSGLDEVITYSFISPEFPDLLRLPDGDWRRDRVVLANPLSIEQSEMRTIMLPSLLWTVANNLSQGNQNINLFELGRVYLPAAGQELPQEKKKVAGCLCGSLGRESWLGGRRQADFFTAKGVVESAFEAVKGSFSVQRSQEPFLHPGKSAELLIGGRSAGYIGEVHPLVLRNFGIDHPVAAFEIDQDALIASSAGIVIFEDLINYPPVFQDIAVAVDAETTAEEVMREVKEAGGPLLRSAHVFDVYAGEQVGEGRKSIALGLEFRSAERTLTDEDVHSARGAIISALERNLNATLRS